MNCTDHDGNTFVFCERDDSLSFFAFHRSLWHSPIGHLKASTFSDQTTFTSSTYPVISRRCQSCGSPSFEISICCLRSNRDLDLNDVINELNDEARREDSIKTAVLPAKKLEARALGTGNTRGDNRRGRDRGRGGKERGGAYTTPTRRLHDAYTTPTRRLHLHFHLHVQQPR